MVDSMMTPRELRDARTASGLSRAEFASRLTLTEAEYRRMERGTEPIPARLDDAIEDLLNSPEYDGVE